MCAVDSPSRPHLLLAAGRGAGRLALALDVGGLALGVQRGGVLQQALRGVLAAVQQHVLHKLQQLLVDLLVHVGAHLRGWVCGCVCGWVDGKWVGVDTAGLGGRQMAKSKP